MSLKVAYFQPVVLAIDQVPPTEFSKIYSLAENLHGIPELNDSGNPFISIRGGTQIQVYPNELNLDVTWLVTWLETICQGYMGIISQQSGTEDLFGTGSGTQLKVRRQCEYPSALAAAAQ